MDRSRADQPRAGQPPAERPRMDRPRAHLALITHAPIRDWRWLGLRRRCRFCGQRFPCPPRQTALDLLTEGIRPA